MIKYVKPLYYCFTVLYLHSRFVYFGIEGAISRASLKGEKISGQIHAIAHFENSLSIALIALMTILLAVLLFKVKVIKTEGAIASFFWIISLSLMLFVV